MPTIVIVRLSVAF